MNQIWHNLKESLSTMNLAQRGALGAVALLTLGMIGWLLAGATQQGFKIIARDLPDPSSASALTERLKAAGIDARVTGDGRTVEVPDRQFAAAARAASERDAMPKRHTGMILEIAKKNSMLLSTEERRLVSLRALEARVEDNLETYDQVRTACVNLSMPHDTGFAQERGAVKAAIILTLKPEAQATRDFLRTMRAAVSHAVDGLLPENISISDSRGNDLTKLIEDSESGSSDFELAARQVYERELTQKVIAQLRPLFGEENLCVSVTMPVSNSGSRGASRRRESARRPGAGVQLASYSQGQEPMASPAPSTPVAAEPERPERLSVSVLVNSNGFVNGLLPDSLKRTAEQLAMAAVGFNSARNDVISVVGAPFRQQLPALVPSRASLQAVGDLLAPHAAWVWGGTTVVMVLALLGVLIYQFPHYRKEDLASDGAGATELQEEYTEHAVLLGLSAQEIEHLLDGDARRDLAMVLASARQPLRDFMMAKVPSDQREILSAQVCCTGACSDPEVRRAKERLFDRLHARD
ncbi:MAG: hypothetical protein HY303_00920 [Candidatus Wallbacteria bacterium]|nr:hypothetical protein [Candidatus Wallbacteria bacterium]